MGNPIYVRKKPFADNVKRFECHSCGYLFPALSGVQCEDCYVISCSCVGCMVRCFCGVE
jgi:hypothetical protein